MNRKDLLAAGGVGLVLTLGWYQFVWQSQGKAATKADAEVMAAKDSVTKLNAQITGLEATRKELETRAELVDRLEAAIPASPELSALVKQLQATAKTRNVELTSISTGQLTAGAVVTSPAGASGTGPSEMAVTLSLHGAYPAIVEFVNDLSAIPRLVVVDSLALSRNDVEQSGNGAVTSADVSATVTAKVFSTALPPAPPGAAPAPAAAPAAGPTTTAAKGGL